MTGVQTCALPIWPKLAFTFVVAIGIYLISTMIWIPYLYYVNSEIESTLEDQKNENTNLTLQLTPFLAVASKSFPDSLPDKQLELLLIKIDEALFKVKEVAKSVIEKRTIDTVTKESIVNKIKTLPSLYVEFYCLLNDSEGFSLATQIQNIFSEGGWKTSAINQLTYFQGMKSFGMVFGRSPSKELQTALLPLFDNLGVPREARVAEPGTDISPNALRIIIGPK